MKQASKVKQPCICRCGFLAVMHVQCIVCLAFSVLCSDVFPLIPLQEVESHDAHVTVVSSDLHEAGYENGYQEQMQDKGMEQADYIPQSSLPATLEPLAPPPPVNTQPIME